jgi:hypothetical protein
MSPISQQLLQQSMLLLLEVALQKGLSLTAAEVDEVIVIRLQEKQQEIEQVLQQRQKAVGETRLFLRRHLLLSDSDASTLQQRLLGLLAQALGWTAAASHHLVSALSGTPAAGAGPGAGSSSAGALAQRHDAHSSRPLMLRALSFAAGLAAAGGAGQEAACGKERMKALKVLMAGRDPCLAQQVDGLYLALLAAMPADQKNKFQLPPPRQAQQMAPPAPRAPQQRHQQPQPPPQQQQQQQPRHRQPQQQPRHQQQPAAVSSQACSVAPGRAAGGSAGAAVWAPEHSQMSQGGGRAASCWVGAADPSQASYQQGQQQLPPVAGADSQATVPQPHAVAGCAAPVAAAGCGLGGGSSQSTVPQPHAYAAAARDAAGSLLAGSSQATIPQPRALAAGFSGERAAAAAAATAAAPRHGGSFGVSPENAAAAGWAAAKRLSAEMQDNAGSGELFDDGDSHHAVSSSGGSSAGHSKRLRPSPPVQEPAQQLKQKQQEQERLDVHSQDQGPTPCAPGAAQQQQQQRPAADPREALMAVMGEVASCVFTGGGSTTEAPGAAAAGASSSRLKAVLTLSDVPWGTERPTLMDRPVRVKGKAAARCGC